MPPKRPRGGNRQVCPNPLCKRVLPSPQGLTNHFLHFSTCAEVNTSVDAILAAAEQTAMDIAAAAALAEVDVNPCDASASDDDAENTRFDFIADYPENDPIVAPDNGRGEC